MSYTNGKHRKAPTHGTVFVILFATIAAATSSTTILNRNGCPVKEVLREAGDNRKELTDVLEHYRDEPEKLAAARFLISGLPEHYSYRGKEAHRYYRFAGKILASDLSPTQQYDTLLWYHDEISPSLGGKISDSETITSEFLIHNIDHAYNEWKHNEWSRHLDFDEFCEWVLPYKSEECQELDSWRDTLKLYYSKSISSILDDDEERGTVFRTADAVRNEILRLTPGFGIYNRSPHPLLSADLLPHITFGRCSDYVNLAVLAYRSVGLPAVIDEAPFWGRYRSGHSWYVLLGDRGQELPAEWDIGSVPGWQFFPYQRIPKVYRHTYSANPRIKKYLSESTYRYPFNPCRNDVTDRYGKPFDIRIKLTHGSGDRVRLAEKYAYIAIFNGLGRDWSIVDFGTVKRGYAHFSNMGRDILYIVLGYDGKDIIPVSDPFILEKSGTVRYIRCDTSSLRDIELRRKYYQSANVVAMRQRLVGGRIQHADQPDFSDTVTVLHIRKTSVPDKIRVDSSAGLHRYWRYIGADGSHGSIAELAFFTADTAVIEGKPIACGHLDDADAAKAFDGDWLTNCETPDNGEADNIWVGMEMQVPEQVSFVRIIPRSDDNDIHPGDEYELRWWNNHTGRWEVSERRTATDNTLKYEGVPAGALLWLHNYTRGWDERAFLIDDRGNVEWR